MKKNSNKLNEKGTQNNLIEKSFYPILCQNVFVFYLQTKPSKQRQNLTAELNLKYNKKLYGKNQTPTKNLD